jgi:hypothetical protein
MNKSSLFAILGIVSALTTALIFGSIVTPASAQGNTTVTMDNVTNMTAPMNNMRGMNMTMVNDTVVMGEPQVAASLGGEGSNGGENEN